MPARVSRNSLLKNRPVKAPSDRRNPKKATRRALNAFSIAQYENPEKVKVRKNRLGELDPSFNKKRSRDDEEGSEDESKESTEPKRRRRTGGNDSSDEGSDSEGNTWQMGHVDEEDDEDIDSDEAFGESDEERFEGFTFRGSSKPQKGKAKNSRQRELQDDDVDVDMKEEKSADNEEGDDDDLGEDAIDLATALDQYEEDEEEEERISRTKKPGASAFDDSDISASEGDTYHGFSSSEEDDGDEGDRQAQLQDLISSLASQERDKAKGRAEAHEYSKPSEFGIQNKVDILSFKPKVMDEEKKVALKLLRDDKPSKRKDIARKLDAPLPKRQQDKTDRAAANAKANETLERWTDTIKQNRRAEHLMFPLQENSADRAPGAKQLQPTTAAAPTNDLESTIQSILQQSGLSSGKGDEKQLMKWEELQTNKLPIEEVMKRRAQLRMERELLFREEIRAKRIKKIKSKSYRRVHRKERERLLQKERDQLKADGVDLSEEERDYNDRRRAEERMGAKHRDSKWAKGIKAVGRAAWDKDALDGVTEMARRNEELRRRVDGKTVRDEDEDNSDLPSDTDYSHDEGESDDDALKRTLGKLKENPFSINGSKLGNMAFMQKAEAAKRQQNDEIIEDIRRQLASEGSASDEENDSFARLGRKKYGPGKVIVPAIQIRQSEFEEGFDSDEEGDLRMQPDKVDGVGTNTLSKVEGKVDKGKSNGLPSAGRRKGGSEMIPQDEEDAAVNPFLVKARKEKQTQKRDEPFLPTGKLSDSNITSKSAGSRPSGKPRSAQTEGSDVPIIDTFLQQRVTTADDDGWATVLGESDNDDDEAEDNEDDGPNLDFVLQNQALTAKGFAGDNVVAEFAAEKKATIAEEESTEIVNYLPGWGSWVGSGLSVSAQKRNKGQKTVTKREGIDAGKRKDKKLDKVIINERRIKPNVKYMASQIPFPFESREQYERSLRVPKGAEWTTKRTFQGATKPRVIVKQGIIAPLKKPLI